MLLCLSFNYLRHFHISGDGVGGDIYKIQASERKDSRFGGSGERRANLLSGLCNVEFTWRLSREWGVWSGPHVSGARAASEQLMSKALHMSSSIPREALCDLRLGPRAHGVVGHC